MPDWVLHWGLLGLVVYGVISAYVPVFNAEGVAIVLGLTTPAWVGLERAFTTPSWVMGVAALTTGIVAGKGSQFVAVRHGARWASGWRKDRPQRQRREPGRVRAWATRWTERSLAVLDHPARGSGVILISSAVGFPPAAVVAVAAATRRVPLAGFLGWSWLGYAIRLGAAAALVAMAR